MPDLNNHLSILEQGEVSMEGQILWGSNYTLLVKVALKDVEVDAVYKPAQGERPLWDFPRESLALREVAAFLINEALGWQMVPPTVYRETGPLGHGSLQLFVDHDPNHHYFKFTPAERQRLRQVALFDILINNADRKSGHIIIDPANHIWLIDHGICFHEYPKLRTILWDFAGERLSDELCNYLTEFRQKLESASEFHTILKRYLSKREIKAMSRRADLLLATGAFPHPPTHSRPYPWPLV